MKIYKEDEKIEWIGKRCLSSLWLLFLIGFLTLPLYGIGIAFIIYAILIWLREDYVVTNKRVMKIVKGWLTTSFSDIFHEEIRGLYTMPRKALNGIYYDLVIENARKIVFKLKEPEIVKKIIEKFARH